MSAEPNISDIDTSPLTGLETHILDPKSYVHEKFLVTYGVRTDDDSMVYHFFAPLNSTWDEEFRMIDRLNTVTGDFYPLSRHKVKGGYTQELDSYFVIVPGAGAALIPPLETAEEYLTALGSCELESAS